MSSFGFFCFWKFANITELDLVHHVSKTHWTTRRRQPSLLTASCCSTSQVMSMLFKSCCMVSIQFFPGLPDFLFVPLIFQCTACHGSLLSSIPRTCPSHLSFLSVMMRSIFSSCVCVLTLSLLTLSFHEIPIILLRNLWCAACSFFFCATVEATILHRITLLLLLLLLWTSLTTRTISLWVWCWYAWYRLFKQI